MLRILWVGFRVRGFEVDRVQGSQNPILIIKAPIVTERVQV